MRFRNAVFAVLMALAFAPGARAQTLSSSMTALCGAASCEDILFTLDVEGDQSVHLISLASNNNALWQFGGVVYIENGAGTDVSSWFTTAVSASQLQLYALSPLPQPEPIFMQIRMATWGTADQVAGGMNYYASGNPGWNTSGTVGTVTPEPATLLLMGTGLLGIGGVAARRRRGMAEAA